MKETTRLHHCGEIVVGDTVRVFLNKQAQDYNRYYMGTVRKVESGLVTVKCLKFKVPVKVMKGLVQVVAAVPTQKRLKAVFGQNAPKPANARKPKKEVKSVYFPTKK